jgi:hypothetical protein
MSQIHRTTKEDIPCSAKRKHGDKSRDDSGDSAGARKRERRKKYRSLDYNDPTGYP